MENLEKEFRDMGYIINKNDYKRGYTVAQDVGGGWTDSNIPPIKFNSLKSAQEWLNKEIKLSEMTEDERMEEAEKEFAKMYEEM